MMYQSLTKINQQQQHDSDTSSYASALDISSPTYHEREAIRWNSAFQLYMNMSQGERAARKLAPADDQEDGAGGAGAIFPALSPDEYRPGHRRDSASLRKSISLTDGDSRVSPPSLHRKIRKDLQHQTTLPLATAETSSAPAPRRPAPCPEIVQTPDEDDDPCFPTEKSVKSDSAVDDGLCVPPVQCEWRNIHSYNTLYKPDVYPFMASLPSGRYGFMTPPVRSLTNYGMSGGGSPRAANSTLVSPTESSLNSLELEAIAAVHELQFVVKDIFVSELLPRTSELIFLNVTTLEGQAYCIELTVKGWRVTSLRHDCMNGDYLHIDLHTCYFETIYSLMDNISDAYKHKFHEALSLRLLQLAACQQEENCAKIDENAAQEEHFQRNNDVRFSVGVDDV